MRPSWKKRGRPLTLSRAGRRAAGFGSNEQKSVHRPRVALWAKLLALPVAVLVLFAVLDARLRPVITTMAKYQCRVVSILAMNEAVIREMEQNPNLAENLVHTVYSDDGVVATVEVDSAGLNRMKARLTEAVTAKLLALEAQDIAIPLGTLLGWQLLAGRGPDVHLKVVPASFVQATTEDKVETAGINQTQHRISIHFSVEMSAILPGYSTSITVENDVVVSETLIVGDVPQMYALMN